MADITDSIPIPASFETHPDRYVHLRIEVAGAVATIRLDVKEDHGLRPGYALKLNSYDLGVDIELADAVQRLRFEHPEVGCVVITSATDGVFCAGANIFMLGSSSHAFKVNFCKYTNETRFSIEDATANSGQIYLAALNGVASGGGYELPLACQEIYLIDDKRSAVALPEVPYLGVLPGTGGITRVTDKRRIRRDRSDVFLTLAEGIKGKRAVEWGLVDGVFPTSRFHAGVADRAATLAAGGHPERNGVTLGPLTVEASRDRLHYPYVDVTFDHAARVATLTVTVPDDAADVPADPSTLGDRFFPLACFRQFEDALLRLRFHFPEIGLVMVETRGNKTAAEAIDGLLATRQDHWFVRETTHFIKRTLKRYDVTSKSFFAVVRPESCFVGTFAELLLGADRGYMQDVAGASVTLTAMNDGFYPMNNGLTRTASRFLSDEEHARTIAATRAPFEPAQAADAGLVTFAFDELDWDDELRLAIEERSSLSPDALSGMEHNVRAAGPETMESKVFGRLSAWQNWIFQRPNAVGARGALTLYGQPLQPQFDYRRC